MTGSAVATVSIAMTILHEIEVKTDDDFQTDNLALLDIRVKLSLYGWVYVLAERVRILN